MDALTFRDELVAIRARLKALDREFKKHTGWLGIAASEIADALKEIPRAELGRRPARVPRPEDSQRGGGSETERAGSIPVGSLATGSRSSADRAPNIAPPPQSETNRARRACKVCGATDHDGRRHRFDGKRAAAATPPTAAPASDDEDPEPAAGADAVIVEHREWAARDLPITGAPATPAWPLPILPTARRVGPQPAPRAVRHMLGAPADGTAGLTPCGALGESVLVTADKAKATCDECLRFVGPKCGRCGGPKHGYGGCPFKGEAGVAELRRRQAEKQARAAAAQVLEVVLTKGPSGPEPAPPAKTCNICGRVGHDGRAIFHRASRSAQPAEPPAEDLPTPSPGRGELLADQRGGARDELAAPPLSAETTERVVPSVGRNSPGIISHDFGGSEAPPSVANRGADEGIVAGGALEYFSDEPAHEAPCSAFAASDEVPKEEACAADPESPVKDRCAESINAPQLNLTSMAAPSAPLARERRAQVCGGCGAAGHNRRACPVLFPRAGAPSVKHEGSVCEKAPVGASTLITPPPPVVMEPLPDTSPSPPALERARRKLAERAESMSAPQRGRQITISGGLSREERQAGAEIEYPADVVRPLDRAACSDMPRPCPFVSCSHHLYLDVNDTGTLKLNFPHLEVWEMAETCSLDVADRGGITLEEVGAILNLTRERIRQVEVRGLAKIKDASGDELGLMPDRDRT